MSRTEILRRVLKLETEIKKVYSEMPDPLPIDSFTRKTIKVLEFAQEQLKEIGDKI